MVIEKELTKGELKQELLQINDIRKEISVTESKIKKIEQEAHIVASVDGSLSEYPYTRTHHKIYAHNQKYIDELNKYLDILRARKLTLTKKLTKLENFIDTLPTSRLRLIFQYKYIDQYTWRKIAYLLHGTEDAIRKEHDKFFKEQ